MYIPNLKGYLIIRDIQLNMMNIYRKRWKKVVVQFLGVINCDGTYNLHQRRISQS
jgi:hypothetical protein